MKADRLLTIIYTCLQRERVTIGELADKLEVSRRTIFRDLEALSAAGIPVVAYPGAGGGVGLMEGFKLDRSLLTNDDFAQLTTALNSIRSIDGNKGVEMLMDKLIPPDKRRENRSDIIIDLSSWFEGEEIDDMFADVRAAIAQCRCIKLAYSTKGVLSERLVEPYKLVFKYHDWYLYAYCRMRRDFRMFRLMRISQYTVTQEGFAPRELGGLVFQLPGQDEPQAPEPEGPPVEIVLAYNVADTNYLADRLGGHSFEVDGGTGTIRFATTNLEWAADLIMGLQDKVRVLQPPQLAQEVRERIERMRRVYER